MATRPWNCPNPKCKPLYGIGIPRKPIPGRSFTCWGCLPYIIAEKWSNTWHENDLSLCMYAERKGLTPWKMNANDWNLLASGCLAALVKLLKEQPKEVILQPSLMSPEMPDDDENGSTD